jgi:hypothetical protein
MAAVMHSVAAVAAAWHRRAPVVDEVLEAAVCFELLGHPPRR